MRNDRVQAKPVLDARPDAVTDSWPADFWYGIGFNQDRAPFDDIRVRQAVHLALNRQDINAIATFGDGAICGPAMIERGGFTLATADLLKLPGYRAEKEADRAEAVKLLDAAGHGGGFKTDLSYWTRLAVAPVYGEAAQPQLAEVLGIDATLVPLDTAAWQAARNGLLPLT